MFHKAIEVEFKEDTELYVTFQTGEIKAYNMSTLYNKYPFMKALDNRELFTSGKLVGSYGIIWNDEIDIEVETIYEEGTTIGCKDVSVNHLVAYAVMMARTKSGLSQKELAEKTGIDQSDISKIERGVGNPSIKTLDRIAKALDMELSIMIA